MIKYIFSCIKSNDKVMVVETNILMLGRFPDFTTTKFQWLHAEFQVINRGRFEELHTPLHHTHPLHQTPPCTTHPLHHTPPAPHPPCTTHTLHPPGCRVGRFLGRDGPGHPLSLAPLKGRSPRVTLTGLAFKAHTASGVLHTRRLELCAPAETQPCNALQISH